MRLWADIYSPAGEALGLVNLVSVEINRALDGVGDMTLEVAGTDPAARSLMGVRRLARVWWINPARGRELLGEGVLLKREMTIAAGGVTARWTAADTLDELRNRSTFRGRVYEDSPVGAVVRDLLGIVGGWSAEIDEGEAIAATTTRRFDGQSVLGAIRAAAGGVGLHLRLKSPRRLQVGKFGQSAGVVVRNIDRGGVKRGVERRAVYLESLTVVEDGYEVVNVVEPLWAAGSAALNLRRSDRTAPYPIMAVAQPDGRMSYRLEDADSIAEYGRVERVITMQDAPFVAGSAVSASNTLYDWAATQLLQMRQPRRTYSVTGVKIDWGVLPGDVVRLAYRGELVNRLGLRVADDEIEGDFYVISVNEMYDINGARAMWEISNTDVGAVDPAHVVADTLMALQAGETGAKLSGQLVQSRADGVLSAGNPIEVELAAPIIEPRPANLVEIGETRIRIVRESSANPRNLRVLINDVEVIGSLLDEEGPPDDVEVMVDDLPPAPPFAGPSYVPVVRVEALTGSGDVEVIVETVVITVT